ncbi:Pkinase-domain-containing protein [Ascodesmis nigricans]|uniref:non-specific serine/threonine protein kinase n=1 Tax=Ascodesmis nigricans TaxID=341454 RepID=A0A4V3SIW3_9PEZI|nr:Pkinase-domain-containing protein [Ascodesmis nigricans]
MEGVSLTEALGGLRIANQTEDSPSPSPSPQTAPSDNPSHSQIHIPDLSSLDDMSRNNGPSSSREFATAGSSSYSLPLASASTSPPHPGQPHHNSFQPPQSRSTFSPPTSAPPSRSSTQFQPNYHANSPYPPSNSNVSVASQYTRLSREPSVASTSGHGLQSRPSQRDRGAADRAYRQSVPSGPYPLQGSGLERHGSYHENVPLASSEEWKDKGAAVEKRREVDANGNVVVRVVKRGVRDFNFGRTLGEGSYSTVSYVLFVLAATDRTTLKEYAIKVLDKRHIIKEDKVKYVNIEKNTLNRLTQHPGVVRLYYTFQDERSLYFVLDLATGGELLSTLKRLGTFDEECSRYYAAQILDTIEYMHSRGVIHRDLKPENVLLDDKMRVKITDFGTAKILDPPRTPRHEGDPNGVSGGDTGDSIEESRANSFVGTAEYVSPELLNDKATCKASDLWAFGCIVFQLLAGRPPFKAGNEYQTFQKIVNLEYEFPKGFPPVAKDLIQKLLVLDPAKRLKIDEIKSHEFFQGVEWGPALWKRKAPRLKPYVPPPEETKIIKLGGSGESGDSGTNGVVNGRPAPPRVITELPPPSELDIEWSPVLQRSNERILKLGNATVQTSPAPHSPDGRGVNGQDPPRRLARFFGGGNAKKRQRLVMVTSAAHVIIASGSDDKKAKTDINLQGLGVVVRRIGGNDSTTWAIDTRDKCYTFEDPKTPASEWIEQVERAREMAAVNYPDGNGFMSSTMSSPSSTITLDAAVKSGQHSGRGDGSGEGRSNKRFSKRASRAGLAAVF